jgi:hypothetical protein
VLEKNCMYCHGKSFFPSKQYHETQWDHFVGVMMDGAGSWYTPHSSSRAAVGVLYPDVSKVTALGAGD